MDRPIVAPVDLPIKDAGLWPSPPSAFAEATADKSAVLRILDRQVDRRTSLPFHQWDAPLFASCVAPGA
jgi:hypothetical protein